MINNICADCIHVKVCGWCDSVMQDACGDFYECDGSIYNAKPKFIEQLKIKDIDRQYNAGVVCENNGNYIIGYEMQGAEETFSIGQPVYDKDKNIMGWLGIGLFENLNYSAKVRVPCEYWQICLPTKFCEVGKQVYTYWQMAEIEPQENIVNKSQG